MGQGASGNIILTGFSYTGKSVVGRKLARRLGWDSVDSDEEVALRAGKPIPEIFAQDGEQSFRELERQVLREACRRERVVIASGGGAVLDTSNRELMQSSGVLLCLEAQPETIYRRLLAAAKRGKEVRPLLIAPDPLERIKSLKESRQPYYALSDWTVHTDNLTIDEVCDEVLRGWEYGRRRLIYSSHLQGGDVPIMVATASESYPILIGWDLLPQIGRRMRNLGLYGSVYVISDDRVFPLYGAQVLNSLSEAGFATKHLTVPQGEESKRLEVAAGIYDWLVSHRAERLDVIVALGGGMVGDLAGFVAATFLRGMPLVHIPTTLMAMVDSSIGGKVAVNHPRAKNLIGAFYQPRLVLSDVHTLNTLPRRELISGWAEVVKHALIMNPELLELLEAHCNELLHLEPELTVEAIKRSAAIKAEVVSADERERGRRTILNYGHTIAHALEAATGYERLLHGEAVAIGMMGAAMLSQRLGLLSQRLVERQWALLEGFGLPTTCPSVDTRDIIQAMELDKKVRVGMVHWVLLKGVGEVVIRDDVPQEIVLSVLQGLVKG
jgi:3-dehydroquinate synthase